LLLDPARPEVPLEVPRPLTLARNEATMVPSVEEEAKSLVRGGGVPGERWLASSPDYMVAASAG